MARLSLSLLGTFRAELDGTRITSFQYNKVKALLAFTAVEAGPHSRESLAGLLWPDLPEATARKNLTQALSGLRQSLGDRGSSRPFLFVTPEAVQFSLSSDHALDVRSFSALLAACDGHAHRHIESCAACAERLRQAADLYRGGFLADFFVGDSLEFEDWTRSQREELREQALRALDHLAGYRERQGDYAQVTGLARRQLELDPWREAAHRQLMRALALQGRRNAALEHYAHFSAALANELAAAPERETAALYKRLRADEPGGLAPRGPPPRTHNFPPRRDPFIGRELELRQIAGLIEQPACHLLTLTGPGGIGKTRLAVQAAEQQAISFNDGVYFVPLVPLGSAEFVVSAIASALGFSFHRADNQIDQLMRYLREKEMLLLLDGVDDLLSEPASAAAVTGLVDDILAQAPRVTLVVTSRERLHRSAEWHFGVQGLEVPPQEFTGQPERYDAVRLYSQRARQVDQGFTLTTDSLASVAKICRLLAGMPLGIEMAASWVLVLSDAEIAEEIQRNLDFLQAPMPNAPERHSSLRAVFDHSWRLLAQNEQRTVARLSVFRGSFERAAAEQVAGASLPALSSLVDKSWLQRNTAGRYDIHEMLRQYAAEKLLGPGEADAVRRAHARYYLALAEAGASPTLAINRLPPLWLDRMGTEYDNIRAALTWSQSASGDAEIGLRLAAAISAYCYFRGFWSEARTWLERALANSDRLDDRRARAQALLSLGHLLALQGDYDAGQAHLTNSLMFLQEVGDISLGARVLFVLGLLAREHGDTMTARLRLEDSLAQYRLLGDPVGGAWAMVTLGEVAVMELDVGGAKTLLEGSLSFFHTNGIPLGVAWAHNHLGHLAQIQADYGRARQLHERSLSLFGEFGENLGLAWAHQSLGEIALAQDNALTARTHLAEAMRLFHALGDRAGLAWCLAGLAACVAAEQPASAAWLWGVADSLRQSIRARQPPGADATHERIRAGTLNRLGEQAFAAEWAGGQAASTEQAIAQVSNLYN